MPKTSPLFPLMEFRVWQVPGVSRAWRLEFAEGDFMLITDVGGYDLPEPSGPYSAMYLSRGNDLLECAPLLSQTRLLLRWVRHVERWRIFQRGQEHLAEKADGPDVEWRPTKK